MVVNSMNIYIQTHTLFNIKTNLPVFFLGFDIVHASSSNGYAPIYFYAFFAIAYTPQPTPPRPTTPGLPTTSPFAPAYATALGHRERPQPMHPFPAYTTRPNLLQHPRPTRPPRPKPTRPPPAYAPATGLIFSNLKPYSNTLTHVENNQNLFFYNETKNNI